MKMWTVVYETTFHGQWKLHKTNQIYNWTQLIENEYYYFGLLVNSFILLMNFSFTNCNCSIKLFY